MSFATLATARFVAGQAVVVHPPHDPWPVLFWAAILVVFLAVVALAAHFANHHDDARAGVAPRRRRWEDAA